MADRTQENTHGVVNDVKSALRGVRGVGDTIRGTVNESIDTAFNEKEGEVANRAIKEKGKADLQATDQHFAHPGTAGENTSASHPVGSGTGLSTGGLSGTKRTVGGTTTGAGAHSGSVGNMGSSVPQNHLGGEPGPTGERY
ncbi:hypothetical protein A1O3_01106 [Capronia epimyces CBS 606.96]|uniref:Uncharacterized protein n=1 Tax=Capronia epimyces CBS 606.96 TaxID=1182542 RepID=W9ZDG0_9EURO|nr:uncharacterized protein A1O3_01106 [Capronia epimyces CBS 606.96]EXJ92554.1 hypothetical protein A1O3_01106 [Capronia epimyces CBS 606.96]